MSGVEDVQVQGSPPPKGGGQPDQHYYYYSWIILFMRSTTPQSSCWWKNLSPRRPGKAYRKQSFYTGCSQLGPASSPCCPPTGPIRRAALQTAVSDAYPSHSVRPSSFPSSPRTEAVSAQVGWLCISSTGSFAERIIDHGELGGGSCPSLP